jgi:hypothetical protein
MDTHLIVFVLSSNENWVYVFDGVINRKCIIIIIIIIWYVFLGKKGDRFKKNIARRLSYTIQATKTSVFFLSPFLIISLSRK